MTISFDNNYIVLSSGRKLYANGLVLGMTADGDVDISEGWDGGLNYQDELLNEFRNPDNLTKEDFKEVADLMIERWKRFKEVIESNRKLLKHCGDVPPL